MAGVSVSSELKWRKYMGSVTLVGLIQFNFLFYAGKGYRPPTIDDDFEHTHTKDEGWAKNTCRAMS